MKRPSRARRSTVSPRTRHTTVADAPPPRTRIPKLRVPGPDERAQSRRLVGEVIGEEQSTLVDVLDNLLNKGVVLSAELILALANVDLVYVRLTAVLCGAASRVPPDAKR